MTTPLNQAKYKQKALVAKRHVLRTSIGEFEKAAALLSKEDAALTVQINGLARTIEHEQRMEASAKLKAQIADLTAAGYKVLPPVKENQLLFKGRPVVIDPTYFMLPQATALDNGKLYADIIKLYGDMQMYDKTTGEPAGTVATALSGGGKAPGMNTPGSGAGSAQPKLGGVHGVGEGWYSPIVYDSNGVKLEHDFAINTRDHHEARNGWWLKHVPSGAITKGFQNEAEAYRWIKGRMAKRAAGAINQYYAQHYTEYDPHPEVK